MSIVDGRDILDAAECDICGGFEVDCKSPTMKHFYRSVNMVCRVYRRNTIPQYNFCQNGNLYICNNLLIYHNRCHTSAPNILSVYLVDLKFNVYSGEYLFRPNKSITIGILFSSHVEDLSGLLMNLPLLILKLKHKKASDELSLGSK